MKLINHSLKRHALYLLTSCVALLFSLPLITLHAQKSRDETDTFIRWEHSDDGLKRRFEARGKPEFTDDYTDIKSVSVGGWVIIEEQRNGQSMRYEVRRDPAGNLTRAFYVNGAARPLDETTRAWLAKFVLDAVRQGGLDAENRVRTILAQKGVAGVLAEIGQISGDYSQRIYYQYLIKRSEEHTSELQSLTNLVCRLLLEKKKKKKIIITL